MRSTPPVPPVAVRAGPSATRSSVRPATAAATPATAPRGAAPHDAAGRLIESALESCLVEASHGPDCPPRLAAAMRHAVFPGGARLRPRLVLAVARAVDARRDAEAQAALRPVARVAAAVELMHCASLVQDDLGCFDAADVRRGRPATHAAFDERLAILASDALIVAAFDALAGAGLEPDVALALVRALARRTGAAGGIAAGQAWESESWVELDRYHDAKTGSLFALSTEVGALAAGVRDPVTRTAWAALGARIGTAYQIADDLKDAAGDASALGKPVNVDARLERPSAAARLGLDGATARLTAEIEALARGVPDCAGRAGFVALLREQAGAFVPAAPASVVARREPVDAA